MDAESKAQVQKSIKPLLTINLNRVNLSKHKLNINISDSTIVNLHHIGLKNAECEEFY